MPRGVRSKRYTAEFNAEAVRLAQTSDRPIRETAAHLGVTAKSLHEWIAALRPAPADRLTGDDRQELDRLRREGPRPPSRDRPSAASSVR